MVYSNPVVADIYDVVSLPLAPARQSIIASQLYDVPWGSHIFEFGVGTGIIAIDLAKRGYYVTGVDHSLAMIRKTDKYAIDEGVANKIRLHHITARRFPVDSRTIDAAVMSYVLTSNPPFSMYHYVSEFSRILKKDGKLIMLDIFIPMASCPFGFIEKGQRRGFEIEKLAWPPGQFLLVMRKTK